MVSEYICPHLCCRHKGTQPVILIHKIMKTEITKPADKSYPRTTITAIVKAPIDQAFHYIAPIYLPHIFPGAGPIPGISGTSINEGWNKAGLSRTVYFKDGTTSQETMLTWNAP